MDTPAIFLPFRFSFFFFNDTATTEIYTLSLHDALRSRPAAEPSPVDRAAPRTCGQCADFSWAAGDRKSTRLNSSHVEISYAVFCLKKKNAGALYLVPDTNSHLH